MPWYVIIGPPAAGKTTALRQSGLDFPFDLTDDLHGVGGTRNCDWFFTEEAVLIDTAGRYVLQESAPEADAAEWLGFLDLLKKHRGRRALNGVIVAVPVDLLAEGDAAIRAHGREIRKRLAELDQRLEMRLPVYLLLTKADLILGFETSFDGLTQCRARAGLGRDLRPGERADGAAVARELAALVARLEGRVGARMEGEEELATRAEIFRFPAQVASLEAPLKTLVDAVFGESRYEDEPVAARLLPDLGHPGGHADRPAGGRARLDLRPARRAAAPDVAGRAAELLPAAALDRRGLPRGGPRDHRPQGRGAPGLGLARRGGRRRRTGGGGDGRLPRRLLRQPRRRGGAGRGVRSPARRPGARRRPPGAGGAVRPRRGAGGGDRGSERKRAGCLACSPAASARPRPRTWRRRRPPPTSWRCATSSSPGWWRCSRPPCGATSAIPTSCSAASRPTG